MSDRPSIYSLSASGDLSVMAPGAPESEDYMQDLVARYPQIIADGDGDLLLIKREQLRRSTRKQYRAEAKIRIVLEGLRGKDSIAELRHREGKSAYR